MNCISLLKKLIFLLNGVSRSTIEAADNENIARTVIEHRKAVERASETTLQGMMVNGKLRASIDRAKSSPFADLEKSLQHQRRGSRSG